MSEKEKEGGEYTATSRGPVVVTAPAHRHLRVTLPRGVYVDIVREEEDLVSVEVVVPKGSEAATTLSETWVDLSLYPPLPAEEEPFRVQSFSD
jgi:hypothetical protein